MLTVLTPTGERPEAFSFCQKYLERQTYQGPVTWLVVDDGTKPLEVTLDRPDWHVEVIRPEPFWKPGDNTQGRNLLVGVDRALELNPNTKLTVWEDDDWYHPEWLERLSTELDRSELVGEGRAVYFNVRTRRHGNLNNYNHASLRCTGMRGGAITCFREVLNRPARYYDLILWKTFAKGRVFHSDLTVGIKGMPGRPGIATGHDPCWGSDDPEMERLYRWIGEEAKTYEKFYQKEPVMAGPEVKQMRALKTFKYAERGTVNAGDVFTLRNKSEEALFLASGRAGPVDGVQPKPREFKTITQEAKLETVKKDVEPEPVEEPTEEEETDTDEDDSEAEADATPRRRGRPRKTGAAE